MTNGAAEVRAGLQGEEVRRRASVEWSPIPTRQRAGHPHGGMRQERETIRKRQDDKRKMLLESQKEGGRDHRRGGGSGGGVA